MQVCRRCNAIYIKLSISRLVGLYYGLYKIGESCTFRSHTSGNFETNSPILSASKVMAYTLLTRGLKRLSSPSMRATWFADYFWAKRL